MAMRGKEEERQKLTLQIKEWNANRLDLFALSQPNEDLEFFGVMRFFFQDDGAKVATKCIRVSSTATTVDVLNTLVEKFRPDMRMLTVPIYTLYEVHVNGEERKLDEHERPLFMQLDWGKDDREGRFLLKREEDKTALVYGDLNQNTQMKPGVPADQTMDGEFQRGGKKRLSKKEKKEIKKKEKEAKLKGKENASPKDGIAEKLYNELPETSFTRSISNPEAVMRRRRQLKLERKLAQFKSKDGGPDSGGTLKIYGEKLFPDVPYKTLLLSSTDPSAFVVMETLNKYGKEKENPDKYCLVQVMTPPEGPAFNPADAREYILEDDECPLAIVMQHAHFKGKIMFHLRRRTKDMPQSKKKKLQNDPVGFPFDPMGMTPMDRLPYLVEINHDGSEPYKALKFRLPVGNTEVGSERNMTFGGHYLQIFGSDIYPRHCVITNQEGLISITPDSKDAEVYINGQRVYENTVMRPGMAVRFGKLAVFRFHDPGLEEPKAPGPPSQAGTQQRGPPGYDPRAPQDETTNFETTFDVDGHIETTAGHAGPSERGPGGPPLDDLLPASLEYVEEGEDAFLASIIDDVNGATVQFKLAPTYTLYMAIRHRIAKLQRPDRSPNERAHWIGQLVVKIAHIIGQTIQESRSSGGALSFWMANASELLHFINQDRDISPVSAEGQDVLASAVELAFQYLVNCMQIELNKSMPAFLDESLDDLQAEDEPCYYRPPGQSHTIGEVITVLSSAMAMLRRCRVNAALTIQLFSQLFHFVNMWLFNKVVKEPRLQLCTRAWGHRLKRRLGRIEIWAEKQGLELAADCHLARIIQAAHLLEAPKASPDDIASISSTCFKLNSIQLRVLLENYIPGPGEPRIPHNLIDSVVSVAKNTADELTRSDGRDIQLEEEPDLQLPFLLPEDGYSCDIVKNIPGGLAEFLDPLGQTGICRMIIHTNASGQWTVHFHGHENQENLQARGSGPEQPGVLPGMFREPEVLNVTFPKVMGSMGLSIVAAKGEGQKERGIYIKSVVSGGAAAQDGRLDAGDQLLEVDGVNLVGLTQEKAAELMTRTGQVVNLKVAKNGAIYHGLAQLLSQPSPIMQRDPRFGGPPSKNRPKSEDVGRFGPPDAVDPRQRGLQNNSLARSSPALHTSISQGLSRMDRKLLTQRKRRFSSLLKEAELRERVAAGDAYILNGYLHRQLARIKRRSMKRAVVQNKTIPLYHSMAVLSENRASLYGAPERGSAKSQEQIPPQDPYNGYRGNAGPPPQSAGPYPGQGYPRDPRELAARSKSTSHLDQPGVDGLDYRQSQSSSTLPRGYPQQPSGPAPQQRPPYDLRAASQPDLNRGEDPRNLTYENYPGPRPGDKYGQPNYVNQNDIRNQMAGRDKVPQSKSLGNISVEQGRGDPSRPDSLRPDSLRPDSLRPDSQRPKSEEVDHSRVREWQQRNEMAEREKGFPGYGQGPYPNPPQGPNTSLPYDHRTQEDPRAKPGMAPKPSVTTKPQEDPRQAEDPRRALYDQKRGYPGSPYQQEQRPSPPSSQPGYGQSPAKPQHGPYGTPSSQGGPLTPTSQGPTPSGYGSQGPTPTSQAIQQSMSRYQTQSQTVIERSSFRGDRPPPGGRLDQSGRRQESPDLPPPPPSDLPPELPPPPPPEDQRPYHPNEMPPPPPAEYEARMREEQMMRQLGRYPGQQDLRQGPQDPRGVQQDPRGVQQDPRGVQQDPRGVQQDPRGRDMDRYPGEKSAPSPHRGSATNYQNMPISSPYTGMSTTPNPTYTHSEPPRGSQYESQPPDASSSFTAYPYAPRPAPSETLSPINPHTPDLEKSLQELSMIAKESQQPGPPRKKPQPPIKPKPKVIAADNKKGSSPSPWEREEKEKERKRLEAETRMRRDQEILMLEQSPHLTSEEQERLKRLRLDREFDRRVMEANLNQEVEEETDMAERAAGRAKMLQIIQDDLSRRQQHLQQDKELRELQQSKAEMDKVERTERKLKQFEQEREEQKRRDQKRQDKRVLETEEYLKKQRELREKQRMELDEARRLQRELDEKQKQKQRDEIQRKKEMEREQLREIQAVREDEERNARRQDDDRFHGYADRPGQAGDDKGHQDPRERFAPPPPERKSSYDIYGKNNSMSQMPPGGDPSQRSLNNSALKQIETNGTVSKKSVSFNANIVTEIHNPRYYGSTSSESSLHHNRYSPTSPTAPGFEQSTPPGYEPAASSGYQPAASTGYQPSASSGYQPPASSGYQPAATSGYQPTASSGYQPAASSGYQPAASTGLQQAPTGYQPSSQGQLPASQGYQPSSQGQLPASQGYQPTSMGHLPSQGYQPVPQGYQPGPQGSYQSPQQGFQSSYESSQYPGQEYSQSGGGGSQGQYSQAPGHYPARGGQDLPPPANTQLYRGSNSSSDPTSPFQRQYNGPTTPSYGGPNDGFDRRTPQGAFVPTTLVSGDTPGVVGAQEVYRDPRDRIAAQKQQNNNYGSVAGERMSFRDKMKLFATEAGEGTPQDKTKISRAQQRLEAQLQTP